MLKAWVFRLQWIYIRPGELEDNVVIPIPIVDRGIKHKYKRIDFNLCQQRLLTISDINTEHKISLRKL